MDSAVQHIPGTWLTIPEAMNYYQIKSRTSLLGLIKTKKFIARRFCGIRIHKELTDQKLLTMPEFKI